MDRQNDAEIVEKLRGICARAHANYTDAAVAAQVSPGTMRHTLATGEMPLRSRARRQIAAFVARNADVRSREDLRFVPWQP